MPDHDSPVRVAENDLGTHLYQAVNEEKPALEHLLVDEDTAPALGCHDQQHTQEVRSQTRPRSIRNRHYRAVHKRVYDITFLLGDENIIATLLQIDSDSSETFGNDAEILMGDILDGDAAAVHCGHSDETSHLQHIRQNPVPCSAQ